ncbi:4-hydroxybenzoate transporter PcaK [Pseudomonas sp. THAF187a]|uniref:MFS transporter n=1 Tax=unclassified Pseudomonas TaxID=196821 RepID=UPI001268C58A|nr:MULTISPECIES: aromatic acid/H+ symport family MFS transporter [unclassified Pseudomonas]QFT21680.1 4-hydroxybenzoate transporter PcaK [Pseudomonas sp. THAF187a]QFT41867.1 4-hydroxybenzoate transporter PcaK [Pseudomonas sp. THAF42]|tara:strand:- start:896 stop:2257 length:1362 start_codon:yes stop_codon:yes gene_type:complete
MSAVQTIDIPSVIDSNRLSRSQLLILMMVGLTVVMDGFDVQSMGYVAPAIIADWGVSKAELGPVFGAGLFGMLVGSLTLSVLADKIGRRPVLIWATVFFSLCMLVTAHVTSIGQLQVIRFVTGLGLGAIMPNALALVGEFSPRNKRVTLMMLVSCGYTIGAVLGGLVSAWMIPLWGWQSVFYLGGIFPLLIAALMYVFVPESMQFLVVKGRRLDEVGRTLRRIDPSLKVDGSTRYALAETAQGSAPVVELFREGRGVATVLLWVVNFMNLLNLYFLSSWLPTIATSAGLSTSTAVMVGTTLQVGGVLGTLLMGPVIDRIGFFKVLVPCFALAALSIALIGQPGIGLPLLFLVVTVTGFCIIGGQPAVNALAATYYPTALRSTGLGWSLGIGRWGSIAGPVLGGLLIQFEWSNSEIFLAMAVPTVIAALMLFLFAHTGGTASAPAARVDGDIVH